jgi:hypothetical protein
MTSQTENDVTIRNIDDVLLLVFNKGFESLVYRSEVTCVFQVASNGALTISASRGRLKPEVTSPFLIVRLRFPINVQYTTLV